MHEACDEDTALQFPGATHRHRDPFPATAPDLSAGIAMLRTGLKEEVDIASRALGLHDEMVPMEAHCFERRDADVPFHKLPFDVMSEIFQLIVSDDWPPHVAVHYSGVCRLWRQIFIDTFQCWTSLRLGNVDLARLCLERSKQAGISFKLVQSLRVSSARNGPVYVFDTMSMEAVQLLVDNISRVKDLQIHLHTQSFMRLLPILRDLSAPALVSLELRDVSPNIWTPTQNDLQTLGGSLDAFPLFAVTPVNALQHLTLFTIMPLAPPGGYKHLVSLTIELRDMCAHIDPLLILLQGCQELVTLHVVIPGPVTGNKRIELILPTLRRLTLEIGAPEGVQYFLERIATPRLEHLNLTLTDLDKDAPDAEIEALAAMFPHIPAFLRQKITDLDVVTAAWRVSITGRTHEHSAGSVFELTLIWGDYDDDLIHAILSEMNASLPALKAVEIV
jgi:hypothetical protein